MARGKSRVVKYTMDRFIKRSTFTAVMAAFLMWNSIVTSDTYTPWTDPTLSGITSQTQSNPTPLTRTTIGLGELVTCSIDPATWSDTDCNVTTGLLVDDTIGTKTWSVTGGGSVAPANGDSTTFTASKSPSTSVVKITVDDSNTKGNDATIEKTITFTVIAPNGVNFGDDDGYASGWPMTSGPPNNYIGIGRTFPVTILPTSVTFKNVTLRENKPGNNWTWPDGTNDSAPAGQPEYTVNTNNGTTDSISSNLDPIGRLDPAPPGGGYNDFQYVVDVPEEYKNQNNEWVQFFGNEKHYRIYRGSDQKCSIKAVGSNTKQSAYYGPWQ